jgi:hypothetical protein
MLETQRKQANAKSSEIENTNAKFGQPFTFKADKTLAYRIYVDNRPRNMEIAALQKGLCLVLNGDELIEEGAGFGVPIAKYSDTTLFSSTAEVFLKSQTENSAIITKEFLLDSVSKKRIKNAYIGENLYHFFHKTFELAYLALKNLRPIFDWIMMYRNTVGVETHFIKTPSRGKIRVTYDCQPDRIVIHVDLSRLDFSNCREILILNEQGATFFSYFKEGNEPVYRNTKIGAWTKVKAKRATFFYADSRLSFSMERIKDVILYKGWEQVKDRFSWAGMTYALKPNTANFDYEITIRNHT